MLNSVDILVDHRYRHSGAVLEGASLVMLCCNRKSEIPCVSRAARTRADPGGLPLFLGLSSAAADEALDLALGALDVGLGAGWLLFTGVELLASRESCPEPAVVLE